jgi:DNA mismatch repair protein MutS2
MYIFPSQSLLADEFNAVKATIAQSCFTPAAAQEILSLTPSTDKNCIELQLGRTEEMRNILADAEPFPVSGYCDVSKELQLLKIENSVLLPSQALQLAALTHTVGLIIKFFNQVGRYPLLTQILNDCIFEPAIAGEIERVLDSFGVVRSSASTELLYIRRALQRQRAESDRAYQQVMARYKKNGWLTDSEESSRNGRRVLSIVAEQKRTINGVIHDISATGKTAFVEPDEVLHINNHIQQLEQDERLEITRIMRQLTVFLRSYNSTLQQYAFILTQMDMHHAKALFALNYRAIKPEITSKPEINLVNASHPILLIQQKDVQKSVVPFSLHLNHDRRILIISGPNAGGKTVCMKAVGLLLIMAQSGIHITAKAGTSVGVFNKLLIDIGDSQSIEYELSTYSSRLKNMKVFFEKVDSKSLFLIDELGSGTDPQLGGALAEAMLEALNLNRSFGIVTTHYMNLKVLADKVQGFINGSMLFDKRNLKPLFQLQVGKPGSSYTFIVAERSGLPQQIINSARSKVPKTHMLLEKLLSKVEKDKIVIEEKLKTVLQKEKTLNMLIKQNDELIYKNENLKNSLQQHLRSHQEDLDRKAEARIKKFALDLKQAKNKKTVIEKFLSEAGLKNKKKEKEVQRTIDPRIINGAVVKLYNGKVSGIVQSIDQENATVLFGNFTTKCKLTDLILDSK